MRVSPLSSRLAVIVEDEWLVRMEIADNLEAAGWNIEEFSSGEAAMAMLEGQSAPDLLVTDIRLLGPMSGWEVAKAYRVTWPGIAVIYASANHPLAEEQVRDSVFMEKPSKIAELVSTADRLWGANH